MSVSNPGLNNTKEHLPPPVFSPASLADTNALLQKVIQQLSPSIRNEIVLRCDSLPALQINGENLETAFHQLLQLLAAKRKAGDKLYLYITCSADKTKEDKRQAGLKTFRIQFHTNITPHAEWMQDAERGINSIASLLLPFGGSFTVNQLKNSGSVFCFTLPGK